MSNPATDYLNDFFADHNFATSNLVSNCCSAPVYGELFKNFGRCSNCFEMAEFVSPEEES